MADENHDFGTVEPFENIQRLSSEEPQWPEPLLVEAAWLCDAWTVTTARGDSISRPGSAPGSASFTRPSISSLQGSRTYSTTRRGSCSTTFSQPIHLDKQRISTARCSHCEARIGDIEVEKVIEKQEGEAGNSDSALVTWDGPTDPENPINMSNPRRWTIILTTGFMTFCVSFASSIFSTTTEVTAEKFGVSQEVMLLGLSLYVLGLAFGPLVWGPLSEVYGRTIPLFSGMILFSIFQIPVAVAQNLYTIFICRFFSGVFGSAPLAIIAGTYVDFCTPEQRGQATAVFAGAVFLGPVAGPIVGSAITQSYLGWRWTAWVTLIAGVSFTAICWMVTPETYEPVLMKRRAKKLRCKTKNWALHAKIEESPVTPSSLANKYLSKPLQMIVKEPILIILTIYMSFVYGVLYLAFEAYPISFHIARGWSPLIASLPFIGLSIGIILACISLAVYARTWHASRMKLTQKLNPEDRMPPMIVGGFLLPIGLFWFAWTSDPNLIWVPQVISGVFVGSGIILIFMSGVLYLVDVYLLNANSAIAVNTFIRSAVAAGFPLFAPYMYARLGVDWATSLLGFLSIALLPFPFIFWFFGAKIRSWSKFAMVL